MVLLACACATGLALRASEPQHVGTWVDAGPAVDERIGAAAVALPDGRTLILGGRDATGTVTDSVVAFDPVTKQVAPMGHLVAARIGHTATSLGDGRVMVIGGSIGATVSDDIEIFDPATGVSLLSGRLLQPRTRHTAAVLANGKVLIAGGTLADGSVTASAELLDPDGATTVPLSASMSVPRRNASATTLIDGRVLVVGGNDSVQDLASAEMFDPTSRLFYPLEASNALSVARSGHTATLLPDNNSVLVTGGTSAGNDVTAADLFVPAEFPDPYSFAIGHFAPTGSLLTARSRAVAGAGGSEGYTYVMGGGDASRELYRFATIKTDKDDYAPGERAIITGSGWQPGETVKLVFQEDPAVHDDYQLSVVADGEGRIYWDQWAPETHDLFVRFYLSASDSKSRAQITFTDAQPQSVTLRPASVTVNAGQSAQYTADVVINGNNNACTVTLSVPTGLPTGASAVFEGNPIIGHSSFSRTLTIATTASGPLQTPTGPYEFTVAVTRGAGCQGNNDPTTKATLIVAGTATTSLTTSSVVGAYGGTAAMSATLLSNGTGVSGKTVSFLLNGALVGTATTGATGVASLTNASLAGINVGSYPSGVSAQFGGDVSYTAASATNALTVDRANAVIAVTGYTGVYDGNSHGATGTATGVAGEDLSSLLHLGATFTDVPGGTANWTFDGNTNYKPASGTAAITISQADATIKVQGYTGVYDGNAHGATGTATGVKSEDLSSLLHLGATFTDVPGGTANWTFDGNTNYKPASGTAPITIRQADATIKVQGYTGIYDGNAHGATGTAAGVKNEDLSSLLHLGATFTDVPGGTASWTFDGNTNYKPANGTAAIAISQADAAINVQGYSGTYDGNAHGATGTAIGVKAENLSSLLHLGATFTDVPGGTASWTFDGNTNYKPASGTAPIAISQADATISVNGFTGVYDGNAHGAIGTAKGVKAEDLSSLLNLGATFTDVPGGTASWAFLGNTNYKPASGTTVITISQADATISVNGYTGTYDGNAHGATGTATGVKTEDLSSLLHLGAPFTDVPGGTAHWTFDGNTNYKPASGSVAITISQADATISVQGYTGIYDGNAHGATGTATGVKDEDLSSLLHLGATFTDVPGGTANWTFDGNTNYKLASGTAPITISQADATINVQGYTGIYDGNAHGATATAIGVKSEDLSSLLHLGATFTDVPGGNASWTFDGNTNYKPASGTAPIAISQADATISVQGYTGVYDGNAHGATGTASGVKAEDLSSLLHLGATFTDVPGGTANWTFDGNTNYKPASGTAAITINQADATINVQGYSGIYDGNAHGATGTATGVKAEDLSSLLHLGATFTDVPGGTANWTFDGNTNYKQASGTTAIAIAKANAAITVTGFTGIYDTHAHGATGSATGAKSENLTALLDLGASFTDVPGGTANWTFAGTNNYHAASGQVSIVINRAPQTISWATPAPIIYGTALTSAQLNATVIVGDGVLSYTPAAGTVPGVGTQTLKVQASQTNNYLATSATVLLRVDPWYLTGFYNPVTMGGSLVLNSVKGGSTVPLKFNIYTRAGGTELTSTQDVAGFQVFPMSCAAATYEDPVDLTTTGGTNLRYDTTGHQFIQNWQTPKGAGQCYRVTMTARDGSTINAFFKTK
jgi:hypothetical protein